MTNAHYHKGGATFLSCNGREFRFYGVHPWIAESAGAGCVAELRSKIAADPVAGVGEIGLDRLKTKVVSATQRELFLVQLKVAAEFRRPVVLHGAKCWGEVLRMAEPFAGEIPAFLFHGFSRSGGLIPGIEAVNGFVSVGKAVLNDHAVNYRELVKRLPAGRILVETDDDGMDSAEREELLAAVFAKVSELTGRTERKLDENAAAFLGVGIISDVRS